MFKYRAQFRQARGDVILETARLQVFKVPGFGVRLAGQALQLT